MQNDLKKFLQMLRTATERIEEHYFRLPVADGDQVYRERVYCYELYHQLRCRWNNFSFRLCGEVDKSNHKWFREGPYSRAKPDLLVHNPGSMDEMDNLAVIEVKYYKKDVRFKHDLKKLTWFCKNAKYLRGIFLVYGEAAEEAIRKKVLRASQSSNRVDIQRIDVFHHAHPRCECKQIICR
jgi:hypothetical protein